MKEHDQRAMGAFLNYTEKISADLEADFVENYPYLEPLLYPYPLKGNPYPFKGNPIKVP